MSARTTVNDWMIWRCISKTGDGWWCMYPFRHLWIEIAISCKNRIRRNTLPSAFRWLDIDIREGKRCLGRNRKRIATDHCRRRREASSKRSRHESNFYSIISRGNLLTSVAIAKTSLLQFGGFDATILSRLKWIFPPCTPLPPSAKNPTPKWQSCRARFILA